MPPNPTRGEFYETMAASSTLRCKVYDAPPPYGRYLLTLAPNTIFGPVLSSVQSDRYMTVETAQGWINVWCSRNSSCEARAVRFAKLVGIDRRVNNS